MFRYRREIQWLAPFWVSKWWMVTECLNGLSHKMRLDEQVREPRMSCFSRKMWGTASGLTPLYIYLALAPLNPWIQYLQCHTFHAYMILRTFLFWALTPAPQKQKPFTTEGLIKTTLITKGKIRQEKRERSIKSCRSRSIIHPHVGHTTFEEGINKT